jgi:hypothetical protein
LQAELTLATNISAARRKLQDLPEGRKQVLQLGESASQRLGSFSEALDYSISREGRVTELPTLKERAAQEEDERTANELEQLEAAEWEKKLKSRQK